MLFRKAEKRKAKLRLAITGTAGSGKTYGALLIAQGLGGKIAMLDTENGSGDLYANLCDYDVGSITAPYTVQKYLEAIKEAENAGYDVIIIDSLSHVWAGEGGLLDQQGKYADANPRSNSFAAWRQITPLHNQLVETILSSPCHIIATMRSKTDYIQVQNDRGKTEIKKVGLAPVQREGMEYEFTTVFDLSANHTVSVSKDRTNLFDGQYFILSKDTGKILNEWLKSGVDVMNPIERRKNIQRVWNDFFTDAKGDKQKAIELIKSIIGDKPSSSWTEEDIEILSKARNKPIQDELQEQQQLDTEQEVTIPDENQD